MTLKNTKLCVELNGPNQPSARRVIILLCVSTCKYVNVTLHLASGINFYRLCQRQDTAGMGRESKGIKLTMKSLPKSSQYVASFLMQDIGLHD